MKNIKLKLARIEKDFTQAQLAEAINMSVATYIKKEQGKTDFYIREAKAICEVLSKDPMELFF